MKKSIYTLTSLAIIIAVTITLTNISFADRSELNIKKQLTQTFDKYGDDCIFSFYSIEEIRPYSILQLEETMALYENSWIPPQKYMDQLDERDKNFLIEKLSVYLASLNEQESNRIIRKIQNWCIIQDQLSLLTDEMDINEQLLLKAFYNLENTRQVFYQFSKSGEFDLTDMTEKEKKQAFIKTMDIIAGLDGAEQMNFYSKMFNQLYLSMK